MVELLPIAHMVDQLYGIHFQLCVGFRSI